MTPESYANVKGLLSMVMGIMIVAGAIALPVLQRLGHIKVDDDPRQMVIGTTVLALFGVALCVSGRLSTRKPKEEYEFTNKAGGR